MTRSSTSLALPFVALIVGALGQYLLHSRFGSYAWTVYLAAVVILVLSVRGVLVGRFAQDQLIVVKKPRRLPPSSISAGVRILGLLTLLSITGALLLWAGDGDSGKAWTLYLLGVVFFIAAFIPWRAPDRFRLPTGSDLVHLLVGILPLLALLALASFARFWQLHSFPQGTWTDEAVNGLYARQILEDPNFRPVYIPETRLPAHFVYLIAAAFRLLGVSTLTLRTLVAAISLATVLLTYLLFRRWFGGGMALLAAGFLAVMRYDLTFSRFAVHGITTPFFEVLVLYLFDRALDRKGLADFAWFGLALGFGLAFYHPLRLLPIVLLVFLVVEFIQQLLRRGTRHAFATYLGDLKFHWLVAVLGLLIALAPVLQFAIRSPDLFFERANTASIFVKRDEPDLGKALWSNTQKHLQMFNVRGDVNGRHNLPHAPMLDPLMGVLFVLGLGLALWNWRQPLNVLMLLLFSTMLLGGILSLDFEAPQSLRSIGVIPALVYFILLPVATLLSAARTRFVQSGRSRQTKKGHRAAAIFNGLSAVSLVILVGILTDLNFVTFFDKQKNDPGAWAAYSTAETIVARELTHNAASYDFLVSALYDQNPTTRFLAGNVRNVHRWTVTDRLPLLPSDSSRGQILLVDRLLESAYHEAIRLYPNATVTEHRPPAGGETLVYEVLIPPSQLQAAHGVTAVFSAGEAPTSGPVKQESLRSLSLDWSTNPPLPLPFVAQLQTTVDAPGYGPYRFELAGTLPATLLIDGSPISSDVVELARGLHELLLTVHGGLGTVDVRWQPPDGSELVSVPSGSLYLPPIINAGLRGEYFASPDWTGAPELVQLDPQLEYYFHVTPLKRPYSVQWSGALFAPKSGTYKFALRSIDAASLMLDGHQVLANPDGGSTTEGAVELGTGWHEIRVRFADKTGGTRIYLYWTPPGEQQREIVPARYLRPPMGEYPSTP